MQQPKSHKNQKLTKQKSAKKIESIESDLEDFNDAMDCLLTQADINIEFLKDDSPGFTEGIEDKEYVVKLLSELSETEQFIVGSYFGLVGYKELTQPEISKKLKLGKETVREYFINAIAKLRNLTSKKYNLSN